MAAIPSYRAEMVGLSERDRTLLRSLLAATQARTGIRWDGGATAPAVHFIDVEGQAGAEFWQSLSETERRDAAIVIATAAPAGVAHWLAKPLRSATLLGVLERMALSARAAAAPAAGAAAPSAAPVRMPARVPKPGEPLGLLDVLDGPAGTTARTVQSAHWPDLVVGSGNTHAMRSAALDQYAIGFAASLEVTRVAKYTGGPMDDELRIDLDTLRWLALLYAPRSEIADRLSFGKRMRLRKPPPFAHLPHKPHHVRMAASLTQHAATQAELAETAGVDEESAQRFLGACAAIGLLDEVPDFVANPAPAANATSFVAAVRVPTFAPRPAAAAVSAAAAPADAAAAATPAAPATETAATEPVAPSEPVVSAEAAAEPAPAPTEQPAAETTSGESGSVLERLRAAREQNRARVAAAIRNISNH